MIKLQSLTLQRGTKTLLQEANLTLFAGQKWGLIGVNGCGKSSLFKLILGQLQPDAGQLDYPKSWRVAHMAQELGDIDRCALDYVLDGDQALRRIEAKLAVAKASDTNQDISHLYAEYEQHEGYSAQARAYQLLHGLGFSQEQAQRSVRTFSGGWRIRLNLAQALMCPSDLLLLDEPTNHLDLDACLWLENWLNQYAGTLIIISHDRDFIDNTVGHIASFESCRLVNYTGHYSAYEKQKAERVSQQKIAFDKQQTRIAEIENFVRRFRAKATKAKQAQSRLKELERMEKLAPAHIDSLFSFRFIPPERSVQTLISFSKVAIGYPDKTILSNVDFSVLGQARIGLLGHNGAGKTSLMKTLAKHLMPLSGECHESEHLKIGYFAQHQLESLDAQASAILHLQRLSPDATEQALRNFLGGFAFEGDRVFETVAGFSGGEKARLALAILAWQKPNILLLDEPTNHLDLDMRQALTLALQAYEGAMIIVSHDRHLLKNTVEEFWLVADNKVEVFEGDLNDYHRWLKDHKKETSPSSQSTQAKGDNDSVQHKTVSKKEQRQKAAQERARLEPLVKVIKTLEKKMELVQSELDTVAQTLTDETLYQGDGKALEDILKKQHELKANLLDLEERWFEKNQALEDQRQQLSEGT